MLHLKHTYIFQQINIHACESKDLSPLVFDIDLLASGGGSNKLICISHQPYFSAPLKNLRKTSFRPQPVAMATHSAVHGGGNYRQSPVAAWIPKPQWGTAEQVAWMYQPSESLQTQVQLHWTQELTSHLLWSLGHCLVSRNLILLLLFICLSAKGFRYKFPWALVWDMRCLCRIARTRIPPHQTHWWPPIVQGGSVHITKEHLCQRATGPCKMPLWEAGGLPWDCNPPELRLSVSCLGLPGVSFPPWESLPWQQQTSPQPFEECSWGWSMTSSEFSMVTKPQTAIGSIT